MDISFVIVNWNTREFLLKCVNSIYKNIPPKILFEIIVVDNDSTDDSVEALKLQFPECKLILNDSNIGFSAANNKGIKKASGRYVCLLNSDVETLPDAIEILINSMDKTDRAAIGGPLVLGPDGSPQLSARPRYFPGVCRSFLQALGLTSVFSSLFYVFSGNTMQVEILSGCCWIVRSDCLGQIGLLDENFFMYGEDIDWCKRFGMNGYPPLYIPEAKVKHYGGASSGLQPIRFYLEMQKANLQLWKKHLSKTGFLIIVLIFFLHHLLRIVVSVSLLFLSPGKKPEYRFKLQRHWKSLTGFRKLTRF